MTLSTWLSLPATTPPDPKGNGTLQAGETQPEANGLDAKRAEAPLSKVLGATLALSTPTIGVFALMVWLAGLNPLWAIFGQILVWIGLARFIHPLLDDFESVTLWAREIGAGASYGFVPSVQDGPAADFVGAIQQIRRREAINRSDLIDRARWNQSLFDSLPDPLLLLDASRKIVQMNSAAKLSFGSGLGKDLGAIIRDPQVFSAVEQVLSQKASHGDCEFRTFGRDEKTFRTRIETLERPGLDGAVALLALQDLTPIRAMERVRQDFVANASHELRTPLAALSGFIETLQGPARDDEQAREKFLSIMNFEAKRLTRLVNDLLSLSSIEGSERIRPTTPCDLAAILNRVSATLAPLAAKRQVTIQIHVEQGAEQVIGNSDELTQLVQNLTDNAIKYGREGSQVTLALRVLENKSIRLSVQDQGEGIAPQHLHRLTERFYRIDTARSRAMGGTGLGLAIVKHIANRHGGKLVIASELGKGTSFSVDLPAA